jgi:hypothetical protein
MLDPNRLCPPILDLFAELNHGSIVIQALAMGWRANIEAYVALALRFNLKPVSRKLSNCRIIFRRV